LTATVTHGLADLLGAPVAFSKEQAGEAVVANGELDEW